MKKQQQQQRHQQPTIAPGMNMQDELEAQATDEEVQQGDSTSVTRLCLDRTPED